MVQDTFQALIKTSKWRKYRSIYQILFRIFPGLICQSMSTDKGTAWLRELDRNLIPSALLDQIKISTDRLKEADRCHNIVESNLEDHVSKMQEALIRINELWWVGVEVAQRIRIVEKEHLLIYWSIKITIYMMALPSDLNLI